MTLKYIGDGSYCPPYPARDLTDEEVKEFGEAALLDTGLYGKVPMSQTIATFPQTEGRDLEGKKTKENKS